MLGSRLAISAILIPCLIGLFVLDARLGSSAPVLFVLCQLLAIRSSWELVRMLGKRTDGLSWTLVAGCNCLVVVAAWIPHWTEHLPAPLAGGGLPLLALAISVLVLFLREAIRFEQPGQSMAVLGAHLLSVGYIGVLLSVTAQLRWVSSDGAYLALGALVVAAKAGDVGGYTIGRLFGRAKLIPRLSPGKTRAGGVGALGGAALGGWAFLHFGCRLLNVESAPVWASLVFGLLMGLVGLIGDLCESLIKRDMDEKDSAALMPGFGGLLDLLDSVLYAGPVAYLLWVTLPL